MRDVARLLAESFCENGGFSKSSFGSSSLSLFSEGKRSGDIPGENVIELSWQDFRDALNVGPEFYERISKMKALGKSANAPLDQSTAEV